MNSLIPLMGQRIYVGLLIFMLLFSVTLANSSIVFGQYKVITPKIGVPIKVVPKVATPLPTISLDKSSYQSADYIKVTITDTAGNANSKSVDKVKFTISGKTFTTKTFYAVETGTNTGKFTYNVKVSSLTSKADTVTVTHGSNTSVKKTATVAAAPVSYAKVAPEVGKTVVPSGTVTKEIAKPVLPPTISLDRSSYQSADYIKVTINYAAGNTNSKIVEYQSFTIYGGSFSTKSFNARETGTNTGIFTESVKISSLTSKADTVTVSLTGSYSNTKKTATVAAAPVSYAKAVPEITQSKDVQKAASKVYVNPSISIAKIDESSVALAITGLAQKEAEPALPISSLVSIINEKESVAIQKENVISSKLASGIASTVIVAEREESLLASMEYLNLKGQLVLSGQASSTEVNQFNAAVSELTETRKTISYDALTTKINPSIATVYASKLSTQYKPVKAVEKVYDTKIKELTLAVNPLQYALKTGLKVQGGQTTVLIDAASLPPAVLSQIQALGTIESKIGTQIQLTLPIEDIDELARIPTIKQIRPPTEIMQHSIISEGVASINADIVQLGGYTGNGIKVAVLDLAFNQGNTEIQNNIDEVKAFRNSFGSSYPIIGTGGQHVHGTAVAEIIVDVAPDVGLHLFTIGTELEFQEAVQYAIDRRDIDIIAMSAGWLNYATDGSSAMSKKLEAAVRSGITVVISAGNYAETHWEGPYADGDSNGWHNFAYDDEGLSIDVVPGRPNSIVVFLLWDRGGDFDLTLIDPNGEIVDRSENIQNGINDVRLETINHSPDSTGYYEIGISCAGTCTPGANLELFSPTDMLEYRTARSSVGVPTDAQGIITVGAVHHEDSSLESFSSQGPTNHNRQVPSIMGPDAVTTLEYSSVYGDGHPFYGTSAAAPHVAGVAALILEQSPNFSPAQVLSKIKEYADKNAVFLSTSSDNIYGNGKVDAQFIVLEAAQSVGLDTSQVTSTQRNTEPAPTAADVNDYNLEEPSSASSRSSWSTDSSGSSTSSYGSSDTSSSGTTAWQQTGSSSQSSQSTGSTGDSSVWSMPTQQEFVQPELKIPGWVKKQVEWWTNGALSDTEFISTLQYMIKNEFIVLPDLPESSGGSSEQIPAWVKQNARWWSQDQISDYDFAKGLEFLVKTGILQI